jgi:sulfate/thiosulfate transport system permease protein
MSVDARVLRGNRRGAARSTFVQRLGLRGVALVYLFVLLIAPVGLIFYKTFEDGLGPPLEAITSPDGLHAFWLTIVCVGIAVPLNTVFGVMAAIVMVRHRFRGKALLNSVIDLPFAISPVVIGLALILIYGQDGWLGSTLEDLGIQVIFSVPGMVLATIFVSLPFVVREVMPILQEIGTDQEQAAETLGASPWQTFRRVTLPAIRWGVAYGVVLATARALGEFGAVSVVSGKISGQTETLPLFVENEYTNFNLAGAYAAAIVLAVLALAVLFSMNLLRRNPELDEGSAVFDPATTNLEKEA